MYMLEKDMCVYTHAYIHVFMHPVSHLLVFQTYGEEEKLFGFICEAAVIKAMAVTNKIEDAGLSQVRHVSVAVI